MKNYCIVSMVFTIIGALFIFPIFDTYYLTELNWNKPLSLVIRYSFMLIIINGIICWIIMAFNLSKWTKDN